MLTKPRWLALSLALSTAMVATSMAAPRTEKAKKAKAAATKSTPAKTNKHADAQKEKITLDVRGADCKECAQALTKALSPIGTNIPMQTGKEQPARVVATVDPSTDLGRLGKAVMDAKAPNHAKMSPSLDLVMFGKFDQATAKKATETLGKIKGVDSAHSNANSTKGELEIRIVGGAVVTADQIHKALHDAGVSASFSKSASS